MMGCLQIRLVASDKEQRCPAGLYFDCHMSNLVEMSDPFLLKCGHQHPMNATILYPTLTPSNVLQ